MGGIAKDVGGVKWDPGGLKQQVSDMNSKPGTTATALLQPILGTQV